LVEDGKGVGKGEIRSKEKPEEDKNAEEIGKLKRGGQPTKSQTG